MSSQEEYFMPAMSQFQAWPPEKGLEFETSILSWSFEDAAFWRGKSVAMSEIINYARSIASTRFREACKGLAPGYVWL